MNKKSLTTGVSLGLVFGVVFWMALDSIPLGITFGIIFGVVFSLTVQSKAEDK
ncbi:hypothetical protein KDC22_14785 [Paenibacillus tritici]|uniref:hypothetical protein n=1 Tax=Paenibacillus tritici TaxID=1873425 RepID=UPI001BA6C0E9|nr:hypothetical protein [Paenibacillus tritici]QUL57632.1 hypothetical protein KDC22_14785 [Paenibacillus tritici]